MARIFAGQTWVFPVRIYFNTVTLPLEPTMSNLTQSIYFIADFMTFVLICGYGACCWLAIPDGVSTSALRSRSQLTGIFSQIKSLAATPSRSRSLAFIPVRA